MTELKIVDIYGLCQRDGSKIRGLQFALRE